MKLERYPVRKLKSEILSIMGKYLDLKTHKVFFFGSRVNGKSNDRSDIDIGILGPQRLPLSTLENIREEMKNLPTLYSIDVVDFQDASEDFRKIAMREVEFIQ